jgi:hypothetical protein
LNNDTQLSWPVGIQTGIAYRIQVRTGLQGASLNFRLGSTYLCIKLYGDSGVSNELVLRTPIEQTFYLRSNQIDTFDIRQDTCTIGQIRSIDIYHNGRQRDDMWSIDWLDITDITTNKSYQ